MWTQRRVSSCPAPVGMRWCFEFPVGVDCSGPEPCCIWLAALRSGRVPRRDTLHRRYYWAKGRRDGISSANERARPLSGEGLPCVGPRTVLLQKNSQGFGFTLRHFIVYPPESALTHPSLKDEENGNGKGCQRGRLEPMDTIFVKSVREQGPAHQAGLCTGDRLVKVNGESVLGKTYSQVIALIQNSESVLELSIMPKNEDVLQLAYSQDAYLKGNDPYMGGAEHLPEPPPICYPGRKGSSAGTVPATATPQTQNQAQNQAQAQPNHTPQAGQNHGLDNLNCRATANTTATPGSTALDNRTAVGVVPPLNTGGDVGHRGAAAEDTSSPAALAVAARQQQHPHPLQQHQHHGGPTPTTTTTTPGSQHHHHHQPYRGRSSSSSAGGGGAAISPLDFHFANHNAAIASASALASSSLPAPRRKGSLPGARSEVCHRALSDWYYSQAAMAAGGTANATGSPGSGSSGGGGGGGAGMPVSPRHRSISQDRLPDLGLSLGNHHHHHHHHRMGGGGWGHSASQDTLLLHYGGGMGGHGGSSSGGQDSYWLGGWGSGGPTSRSCSENLLAAAYEAYDQGYERSLEALEQASALISPRYDRAPAWPQYHAHHHQQQQQHHQHHHGQPIRSGDRTGSQANHRTAIAATVPPPGRTGQAHHHYHQQQKLAQVAQAQARGRHHPAGTAQMASPASSADEQTVGYRSYSPSFCRKAGHLMQQSHSFRDPSYTGPHLNWAPTPPRTSPPEGADVGDVTQAQASPSPPTSLNSQESGTSSATTAVTAVAGGVTRRGSGPVEEPMVAQTVSQTQAQSPATPTQTQVQEVVLRQKPPAGRRNAQGIRPYTHYVLPSEIHPDSPPSPSPAGRRAQPQAHRRPNGSLGPQPSEPDSLASIPFIDEPTSPSVDLCARHVPASSVVSSGVCPSPVAPSSPAPAPAPVPVSSSSAAPSSAATLTPSPAPSSAHSHSPSPSPALLSSTTTTATTSSASPLSPPLISSLAQLFSSASSNAKNSRRSSYLLAITTERSKSCDEGLNTFREENRLFTRLPKRVKSFFTDGSLESLRAAEEARSKRHSTSELGNLTLTDIRKEGWLHYKQILTEKGKKVGGGMRPWKRVFSVLRSHSLFLYKDKREAVLHGAGAGSHGGGSSHAEDEQPINIRGCLIDIAYSETKRKHSLRLTTQDFCEYLLQAEDRDDMLGWIRVIRENSKTDSEDMGFSRQALINKKLNDYRKQSPTGSKPDTSPRVHRMMPPFLLSKTDNTSGTNRSPKTDGKDESSPPKTPWGINIMKKGKKTGPKAFGVRLEDCQPGVNNKFVPLIVEVCCGLVEGMGLEYTGVYRVPGNNAMVSSLQEQLNKGMEINTAEEKWQDLNVISSLLKSFFRKLPEPLFTDDKYNDFIDANRLDETGERLKTIRKLIHDLPDHYFHTLKFLVGHLKTVADHSEKNKMEPRNLALVFGPTLVRTSEDNMTDMVTHMPDRYKIIETLILHHAWFFSDELDKDEKTPEEQKDQTPIPNIDHLLPNIGRTIPLGDASDSTNSDSVKSKDSPASKKDLSAKDFLPLSIISAVTRKRKKHQSSSGGSSSITRPPGNNNNNKDDDDDSISTDDEDSEHEPIKASHYGGEKKRDKAPTAEQEEDEDDGEEDGDEDEEEREGEEEEEKRSSRRRRRKGRAVAGAEKRRVKDEQEEGMDKESKRTEGRQQSSPAQLGGGGGTREEVEKEEKQEAGERKRETMNQRGGQGADEERKGGQVRATAAWQGDGRPMEKERNKEEEEEKKEKKEDKGKGGGGGGEGDGGVAVPQARPPPPRSFLYRHARSSAKSITSPSATNTVTSPLTPTSPLYSPSSTTSSSSIFLPSPTSPTSPFAQAGGEPPLTRKKLRRGERVRPHSMYSDSRSSTSSTPRVADQPGIPSPGGGGGGVGGVGSPRTGGPWWGVPRHRGASTTTQTPTPTIITSAPVFDYDPESLRVSAAAAAARSPDWTERATISTAAVSPSVPIPVPVPSSGQVGWGGAGRRPPVSPETRRRRRDWRRHTVVVGLSGEG